ncbi:hypothetical protein [Litorimonas sp. WD9-15]|uniref:hypothetical protein n=1 Tax=Litorimonas sp. WD9-15 TaxID=3418716 RepID=UPI003D06973D
MLNFKKTSLLTLILISTNTSANADLFFDPERSAQLSILIPVESVRQTSEYICGDSALYISAFAATSDINGSRASVSGKIVSANQSHDISEHLTKSINSDDLIYRSMSVRCGESSGAFEIVFSLGKSFEGNKKSRIDSTSIQVFSDGLVLGSRSTKRKPK